MITEQEMERRMMILKIIWSAMLMSLAVYLVVGRLIVPIMPSPMGSEAFAPLRIVLYVLAFATLIASRYVRRLILAGGGRSVDAAQAQAAAIMPKYSGAVIASLAMGESIAIYGLVLFLLGRNAVDLYLLIGISAAAMVYYRPKKEELAFLFREGS
jgi:hypothetical protein